MLKQFLHHLSANGLANPSERIVLAVSGGLDSMVMLDLFVKGGFRVAVAHVNFQLRGAESDADEAFVQGACARLQIPVFTTRVDTQTYASEHGLSIQMAARELRYAWFAHLVDDHKFAALATAHHANDNLETVLLNWIHGSSLQGGLGIAARNGKIIRPLLPFTRQQLAEYAAGAGLAWREDSSNATSDYARNLLRNQVLPLLKQVNPSLEETFLRGQRKTRDELAFYEAAVTRWKEANVRPQPGGCAIDKKAFDTGASAALLHKVLLAYGFSFDVCEEVVRALNGQSGKRFLSDTHELVVDRTHLFVTATAPDPGQVFIARGQPEATLGGMRMTVAPGTGISDRPAIASLDATRLVYPLCWRPWREGDVFCPLGMEGKKKVSDFLIDAKVPVSEKRTITVLESGSDIVWVVGYRIDNRYKVLDTSTQILCLTTFAT